jgi:hypothetical protein
VILAASCSGTGSRRSVLTKQAPRYPDAEGVVVDVNPQRIALDGGRAFRISALVESFTARGHAATSLARWKDKYVQVGVNADKEAVWISGVGVVIKGTPPTVFYTGVFRGLEGRRAIFADGTVLTLAPGVAAPRKGAESLATLDASRHLVIRLTAQAARGG